ncbi:MAG TPA: DUF1232 domain-containing protein [Bacteroidota bacterium]|nr:DUF1232 domain-containing protein [Bacteroidota bacterium]
MTQTTDIQTQEIFVRENFANKIAHLNRRLRLVADAIALFRFMTDPDVHWVKKSVVIAALLYFIIPVDSIPDLAPIVGYLDDAGVVTAAVKFLGRQLKAYYM